MSVVLGCDQMRVSVVSSNAYVSKGVSGLLNNGGDSVLKNRGEVNGGGSVSSDDELGDSSTVVDGGDGSDEEEEEVQSGLNGALGSMSSLEDALPIKRGFSNHFTGKSKSFANLAEVAKVTQLAKPDHPYNKRRRILLANRFFSMTDFRTVQTFEDDDNDRQGLHSNVELNKKAKY